MPAGNITADGELLQTVDNEYITKWSGNDWSANLDLNGTFGGGTVTVYVKTDAGTFIALADGGAFTANANKKLNFAHKKTIKVTLAGATAPNLDWNLE